MEKLQFASNQIDNRPSVLNEETFARFKVFERSKENIRKRIVINVSGPQIKQTTKFNFRKVYSYLSISW